LSRSDISISEDRLLDAVVVDDIVRSEVDDTGREGREEEDWEVGEGG